MVRFAVLAALVAACFAAAPSAHAAVLGVDVESTAAATLAEAGALSSSAILSRTAEAFALSLVSRDALASKTFRRPSR